MELIDRTFAELTPKETGCTLPFGELVPSLHNENKWFLFRELSDEVVVIVERDHSGRPKITCEPTLSGWQEKQLKSILL